MAGDTGIDNSCSQFDCHVNRADTFHRSGHSENPNTRVHLQRNQTSLSKSSAEPLEPAKWCINETIDCFFAVSTNLRVQDSTNPYDSTVGQCTTHRSHCMQDQVRRKRKLSSSLTFQQVSSLTTHSQTSRSEMLWELCGQTRVLKSQVRTTEILEPSQFKRSPRQHPAGSGGCGSTKPTPPLMLQSGGISSFTGQAPR